LNYAETVSAKNRVSMKTALVVTVRQTAAEVFEKTSAIRRERGVGGLADRALRKLARPVVTWGGLRFFERSLDVDRDTPLDEPAADDSAASVTRPSPAPGFYAREFSASDLDALGTGGDPEQTAPALVERFRRGDRAFGAVDAAGRVCHVRWVSTSRVHIPEIGRDIVLGPGTAYFYNGYTRPDARRRGVDALVRHCIFDTLRREGVRKVCSYVRLDNHAGLRAAARVQQAIGGVRYLTAGRFRPIVWRADGAPLPVLASPRTATPQDREDAWHEWFTSWVGRPLSQRSTGCAALDDASMQSAARFIVDALALAPEADRVLDVGCDSGVVTRFVAPHAQSLLGIDFIHEMLKDSRSLRFTVGGRGNPWLVTADACRLPIRSGAFGKVYSSAMLHTMPTRELGLRAIDEMIRVTASGGTVLLTSVPDRAKRRASRLYVWQHATLIDRITLPIRWLLPPAVKQFARRLLRQPRTGLPEFLDYDLRDIARLLTARGLRCELRDFPAGYWSSEFRSSRSNLLIFVP
jgi:SAM-dependent methyltransferase